MKLHRMTLIFQYLVLLPFLVQCQAEKSYEYDVSNPQTIRLEKNLNEISGIEILNNNIYAIADNKGSLYRLDIRNGAVLDQWKFSQSKDFEGLAFALNRFYVLNSNGDLLSIVLTDSSQSQRVEEFKFPFKGKNEFEILYYDDSLQKLVMICKECELDNKQRISAFSFDPSTNQYAENPFFIDGEALSKLMSNGKDKKIKASGAAIHPVTGELFIVSSINKFILVTDRQGRPKRVIDLKRKIFEQPEGISFTANGDMYISNEAGEKGVAEILVFSYEQK
jgi:uncharacterized protein YjiK